MKYGRFFVASALVLLTTSLCPAAVFEWADPVSGTFDESGNWNLLSGSGTFPIAGDTALFNKSGTYQVQFNTAAESGRIDFQAGDVTFHGAAPGQTYTLSGGSQDAVLSGGTLTLGAINAPLDLLVGEDLDLQLDAVLRVTSGSLLDVGSSIQVGLGNNTSTAVVVDGAGSRLDVAAGVILGATGATGTLTLQNDSIDNVISGNLSIATHLGDNVTGRLEVLSDSTLQTDSIFMAAPLLVGGPNLTAELTVDGTNSALTMTGASTLSIGKPGAAYSAAVVVDNGGELNTGTGLISIGGGGSLSIGGGGSTSPLDDGVVNANGPLVMSTFAELTLDGGVLNANAGFDNTAGLFRFRDGTLTVTNGGFTFNTTQFLGNYAVDGFDDDDLPQLKFGAGAALVFQREIAIGLNNSGEMSIIAGGLVNSDSGTIAVLSDSIGKVTVSGTGSTWTNYSDLSVGNIGTGTLDVAEGGVVSNAVGYIGRDADSNGTATVTGDGSRWDNSSNLFVGESGTGTLMVEGGGMVSNTSGYIGNSDGSTGTATVTGDDSQWNNSGSLAVGLEGTGTLSVEGGGVVSNADSVIGVFSSSDGTATVTGSSSQWNNSILHVAGRGTGTLSVSAGGVVSNTIGRIGFSAGSIGTATVTGSGSQWINSIGLRVGGGDAAAGGMGTLTITDQALVDAGSSLRLWNTGTITLDGGSLVTDTFDNTDGGAFQFIVGSLTVETGFTIGDDPAGVFPSSFSADIDRHLITSATTNVSASRTLALNGGSLTTNSLNVNGTFLFNSGTLELTGGGVTGLSELNVPTNGTLRAAGVLNLPVSAAAGSQIVATGDLTLGDLSQAAGFYSNGNVNVANHTMMLADANDAVFDSGANITLGDDGDPGAIAAAGGLTLDFGGNISGHGTIDTPDSAATPTVNNGHIAGNSIAEPITLTGYVKGVGTLDNVVITGTDAPGFSPAMVVRGSVVYDGTLQIEIGGTTPGDFDQINHILGDGLAELGGELDVLLINGFIPALNESFEIVTASGGVDGMFTTLAEELPALSSGLEWAFDYSANNVVLSVVAAGLAGDYNADGSVDAADYVFWRKNDGSQDGYNTWRANFGQTVGSGSLSKATVPEPTSGSLVMLAAAIAAWTMRRLASQIPSTQCRVNRHEPRRLRQT